MKKIILSMFLLGTLLSAKAQVPTYVPTNGLVGYWPFSGNANDASGNGNNGTLVNGPSATTDRFNNTNSAYSFDGINDNITCGNISSLNSVTTLSMSCWINCLTLDDYKRIISVKENGNDDFKGYNLKLMGVDEGGTGKIGGNIRNGTSYNASGYSSVKPQRNTWYHVVTLFDGNATGNAARYKIYINGLLDSLSYSGTVAPQLSNNTYPLMFGGAYLMPNYYFSGKIDDIGIWNRALTQQEINNLYNGNICYQTISVIDTLIINVKRTSYNPLAYANTIKVYPNPTKDKITIDNGDLTKMTGYSIKIYNSIGQQLFQSNITQQQFSLDITQWGSNGIYFMELKDNNGNIVDVKKIVLQ